MRRTNILVAAVLAALLAVTSCTGQPAATSHPTRRSTSPTPTAKPSQRPTVAVPPTANTVWTYDKQRPMRRFEKVGEALVGMTLKKKRLRLTALDPDTGQVLWDKPSSPGYNPPGVSGDFLALGNKVAYLDPVSVEYHFWTSIMVIDAFSGDLLAYSPKVFEVDGQLSSCGHSICFDGYDDAGDGSHEEKSWVMNPLTGAVRSTGRVPVDDWRTIGDGGLIELNNGREVGRQVKGKLLWHRTWKGIFGPDYSASGGWNWEYDAKHHLITGEVGWLPKNYKTAVEDMSRRHIMVGLDSRTGKLRWKQRGVTRFCDAAAFLAELPGSDDDYRCFYRSGTYDPRKSAKVWLKDVGITVQRFDHVTNQVRWSVPLDAYSVSDTYAEPTIRMLDDHHLLGRQHRHVIAFDLRDGTTTTLPSNTVGWCSYSDYVAYASSPYDGAGKERLTGNLLIPCGTDGKETKITRLPPKSLSAIVGDIHAVTGKRAVTGLRAG